MVSVSPLHGVEGEILGVLGIARDMTETKKLEQRIRNSEKLASVGRLAAGVAHEINNPLGGILNCLYNLRKGTLSPSRQEEYRVSMEDGVRRVQKIVRQLLDFSQQHEPEFALTEINHVVDRVLVLTTHLFAPNRIVLETGFGQGLPNVMVDRHMIEQVLMNLVLNAVQAMQEGGVLSIRTSVVEGVCLIEAATRDRVFRRQFCRGFSIPSLRRNAKAKEPDSACRSVWASSSVTEERSWWTAKSERGRPLPLCLPVSRNVRRWRGCHEGAQDTNCR